MDELEPFVDIHCHLVPGIDDGAQNWDDSLAMARMASGDGIGTIVVTPHQMGNFQHNSGDEIRRRSDKEYRLKEGTFTTCDCGPGNVPSWRIEGDSVDVTVDGYAKVRGTKFKVKDTPVAYFPYGIFPVKNWYPRLATEVVASAVCTIFSIAALLVSCPTPIAAIISCTAAAP